MSENDFTYMVNSISSELVGMIMDDYKCDRKKALDILYHSDIYNKLLNPDTGLYYQSAPYVYEYLTNEKDGK